MRVLLASHTAPGGVFRVGSHHLARELAAQGHQVLHLSSPVSLAHVLHLRDREVRRRYRLAARSIRSCDQAGDLLPFTLLPMSLGSRLSSGHALRTTVPGLRGSLARLGFARVDALVVDQPLLAGLERYVQADRVVYRSTDVVETPAKLAGEAHILTRADGVVGTSPAVLERLLRTRPGVPSLVLENGVEFGHFHRAEPAVERRGAVYVGAIDARFDWSGLVAMSSSNPQVPVSVWGPIQTQHPPDLPANLRMRGPAQYDDVPALLAGARVGVMPFEQTDLNRGRSPMKFYEYLAAGLNVVTTMPLSDSQRGAPGVWSVADEQVGGDALRLAHGADRNAAGVELARSMDWSERAARLADFVGGLAVRRAA